MTLTHQVGDAEIRFTPPPTARDVLDWTVWIAARDTQEGVKDTARNALVWAAQWTEYTAEQLDAELAEHSENAFVALVHLCNAIAESAGLPADVLDDLATLMRRKTANREGWDLGAYERWRAPGACNCTRCRSALVGVDMENGKGEVCIYDDIDPRALVALRAADLERPDEPYYATQVRAVTASEESRRWLYEKHRKEGHDEYKSKLVDKGILRRDH